jgi:hypothetical protein
LSGGDFLESESWKGTIFAISIMQSACDFLLVKTHQRVWHRGEKYVDQNRVTIKHLSDKQAEAVVQGTQPYQVLLKFSGGGISKRCNCPYAEGTTARQPACKHMVALAILWDKNRGIKQPSKDEVEEFTIAPPPVSRAEIRAMYRNPLKVKLEHLRLASESGLWSRPHARLPNCPDFNTDPNVPLTRAEVEKAFNIIARWSHRRHYDLYYCAGEMVAAFCEVLRFIKSRLAATNPRIASQILRNAQIFHYQLVINLIDDSDGLHEFTEAHLEDLYQAIIKVVSSGDKQTQKWLKEFNHHREDY